MHEPNFPFKRYELYKNLGIWLDFDFCFKYKMAGLIQNIIKIILSNL